jgi:enolase-phosphatase E1
LRAIVLDIEGTTTPVAFVYETLFPYARAHLRRYLHTHGDSPQFRPVLRQLRLEHDEDVHRVMADGKWKSVPSVESIERYVLWLMDRDRKSQGLKDLQGRIWAEGYERHELTGQVFDDVAPALRHWQSRGIAVGIYSSGSVLAQQLLFRYSTQGDLTPLLRWHFDTAVGAKTDPESYRRITSTLAVPASAVLFVSDSVPELDAAAVAGLETSLCVRPGNAAPSPGHGHSSIQSFDDLRRGEPTP